MGEKMDVGFKEVKQVQYMSHLLAIREFADLLLQALYDKAGKGLEDSTKQVNWLKSVALEKFLNDNPRRFLVFFIGGVSNSLEIKKGMAEFFKHVRVVSKNISEHQTHHSCAVNIALAFDKMTMQTKLLKVNDNLLEDFKSIFTKVFKIESTSLKKNWLEGKSDPKYNIMFQIPKIVKGKDPAR